MVINRKKKIQVSKVNKIPKTSEPQKSSPRKKENAKALTLNTNNLLTNPPSSPSPSQKSVLEYFQPRNNSSSYSSAIESKKKMIRTEESGHQPIEPTNRDTPSPISVEEMCVKMSLDEFHYNTNIVELIKIYFEKQNHPKELLTKMLRMINTYVKRVYTRYMAKPEYRKDELFHNLKILPKPIELSDVESNRSDSSGFSQASNKRKCTSPKRKLKSPKKGKNMHSISPKGKENKANKNNDPALQEGCSKWFYGSQTVSQKQANKKSVSDTQKILPNIQKESCMSPKDIEDACIKMSFNEFRDNTNILELIKEYFMKQNHPKDLLKKMLDSIDIYVERVYNRYVRKPAYRHDDLFKNLKIVSKTACDQSESDNIGTDISSSTQSTIITNIGRVNTYQSNPLQDSSKNSSGSGRDIMADNLSELSVTSETNITKRGDKVKDKPCPLSKKVIKTSEELNANINLQLKPLKADQPVLQQQNLNANPPAQEGCSKWFYGSQTVAEKQPDKKSENNTQKLLLCNRKENYIPPKGVEEICVKMSLKEFRDNTNIVELIKDYFIKQNHPNDLLKKMIGSIDAYVERVYNRYIRKPAYRQDDLFKNLKIISRLAWEQSESESIGTELSSSTQSTVITKISRRAVSPKKTTNQANKNGQSVMTDNLSENIASSEQHITKLDGIVREKPCPLSKKQIQTSEGINASKIATKSNEKQLLPMKRKCGSSIDSDPIEADSLLQSSEGSHTSEAVKSGPSKLASFTGQPCIEAPKSRQKIQKCIEATMPCPLSKKKKLIDQVDTKNNDESPIPEDTVSLHSTTAPKPQLIDVPDRVKLNKSTINVSPPTQDKSGASAKKNNLSLQKTVKKLTDLQCKRENIDCDETIQFLPKKRKCETIVDDNTEKNSSPVALFKNVDEPKSNATGSNIDGTTRNAESISRSKEVMLERSCTLTANQQQTKRNDLGGDLPCPLSKKIKQAETEPCADTEKKKENILMNTLNKEQNNAKNTPCIEQKKVEINDKNKGHKSSERQKNPQKEAKLLKSPMISPSKQSSPLQNNEDPNNIIRTATTDHGKSRLSLGKSPIKYTSIDPKNMITPVLLGKLIESLAKNQEVLNKAVYSSLEAVAENCNKLPQTIGHETISSKQIENNIFTPTKQLNVTNECMITDNALNDTTKSSRFLNSTVVENTNVHQVATIQNDAEITSHEINEIVQGNPLNPAKANENDIVIKEEMNCTCHSNYDDDVEILPTTPQKQIVIHDTPTDTEEMFHMMMNPIINDYHETIIHYPVEIAANVVVENVVQDDITLFVSSDENENSQDREITSTPILISSGSTDEVPPTPEQLEKNAVEENQPNNIQVQHVFVLPNKIRNISSPKSVSGSPVKRRRVLQPKHKFIKPLIIRKTRKPLRRCNIVSFIENDGRDFLIEEDSSPESSPQDNLQPINASPPEPMPPTNSQLLNEDETYFRNATLFSQKEQTLIRDNTSHDADAPVKLMPEFSPVREVSEVAKSAPISEHQRLAQASKRPFINSSYMPRSIKCRNYTCLTYVDIRSVSFEREVNRICYESNLPFMELQEEKQVKATIKVNFDRCKSLHIHGDTLRILLGLTSREWKCVMKLFKVIEVFDYKASDSEPTSRSLPYRILYHLFKTLPRFSQAVLQCDPTSAHDEVKCVEMKVEYFKPVQTLSQAFKPFILEKMKQLKLNLNNM